MGARTILVRPHTRAALGDLPADLFVMLFGVTYPVPRAATAPSTGDRVDLPCGPPTRGGAALRVPNTPNLDFAEAVRTAVLHDARRDHSDSPSARWVRVAELALSVRPEHTQHNGDVAQRRAGAAQLSEHGSSRACPRHTIRANRCPSSSDSLCALTGSAIRSQPRTPT